MGEAKRRKALDPNYGKPRKPKLKLHLQRIGDISKIHYYSIGQRPNSINFEIPELLTLSYIDFLYYVPKGLLQIIDPLLWNLDNIKHKRYSNIDFSILFDDYPEKEYDLIFNQPIKIIVIFLNTESSKIFRKIESLNRPLLISSENESIKSKIKNSKRLNKKYFNIRNYGKFIEHLLNFVLEESEINKNFFLSQQNSKDEKAKEILNSFGYEKSPGFLACRANTANVRQLFSVNNLSLLKHEDIAFEDRIKSLISTSTALINLSNWMNLNEYLKSSESLLDSTLILIYPYINPTYRKILKDEIRKGFPKDDRDTYKKILSIRFLEQSISDYSFELQESVSLDDSIGMALSAKQAYTRFLDFVGYLHSTFKNSPCIRTPHRGASLNPYISRLSPSQYRRTQNIRSIRENIFEIGEAIKDNCPPDFINLIESNVDSIFSISDLPLEWMLIDDIPLSFLCDLCRIPETGPTSIISQFNRHCSQEFQVKKDLPSKTMIICGALEDDLIFNRFNENIQTSRETAYKAIHILSKSKFFEEINKFNPDLLIIDSHGGFDNQQEGSYIMMGNEKVTGVDIVEQAPQIPLVILSCCWSAPIYGNSNIIAQAFFEGTGVLKGLR